MYDSEVMCRQKVDTPWYIYRDFTVLLIVIIIFLFLPQIIVIVIVIKLKKNPITTNYYFYITLQKCIARSAGSRAEIKFVNKLK